MSYKKHTLADNAHYPAAMTNHSKVEDVSMQEPSRRRRKIVKLPHLTPEIELSDALAEVLEILINAGNDGVSTVEFGRLEIANHSQKIRELKKRGAIISTVQGPEYDSRGNCHHNTGRYFFNGWANV